MREIKFRAWDKDNKIMSRPLNVWEAKDMLTGVYLTHTIRDPKDFLPELMQYTGLKDKNGKEIWEGDLIRITSTPGKDAFRDNLPDTNSIAKVFFKDGAFQTNFYNSLLRIALPGNWQVEVIRNIYENPELLK